MLDSYAVNHINVGAILSDGTNWNIDGSTFYNNSASSLHGGVFLLIGTEENFIVSNSSFIANSVHFHCKLNVNCFKAGQNQGGAIYSDSENVFISDCIFSQNMGGSGGAISISKAAFEVTNSNFIGT